MYLFSLLTVGKLKNPYWRDAEVEYLKRLKPYARCTVHEMKETRFTNPADRERVIGQEGELLLKAIPQNAYVCALAPAGKEMTSEKFAKFVQGTGEQGQQIVFIIGGPLGLSYPVYSKAAMTLSLSSLTLTHELARIVLLEQLYRAMTLVNGKKYHY